MQIHWLSVKNDQTIIIFMHLRWCQNFLYDDMEQLAICRDLLLVLYASAKTFRIVWTITKTVMCFSPWTILFQVRFKVPLSLLYSAVISAWKDIIELSDTPRPH